MKKLLLLAPAFALMTFTPAAQAASSADCQVMLERPVSTHYVQKVIDRAFTGLNEARKLPKKGAIPAWIDDVQSAEAQLLDSQVQLSQQEAQLDRASACLNYDSVLLECVMDEVRAEIKGQLENGSEDALRALLQLLTFVNERRRQLILGAMDPLYSDPGWYTSFAFDPANTVYDQAKLDADGPMCPFTSDYAPAFLNGFGCDVPLLSQRTDYEPVSAEYEALSQIDRQIKQFQSGAVALSDIQKQIDELFGNPSTALPVQAEYEHKIAYGCGWSGGYCEQNITQRCVNDGDCAAGRCKMTTSVCRNNRALRCWNNAQCDDGDECMEKEDATLSFRSIRTPFSAEKDETALLMEFLGIRTAQEVSREFRDDLKTPSEFREDQTDEKGNREFDDRNPFARYFRQSQRALVRIWGRIQGRREATMFPAAVDSQLQVADALTSLRAAVAKLAKLATMRANDSPTKTKGLRDFVMSYAFFLNRTCLSRPCSQTLEQVMRIVGTTECFPYTSGEFLSDNAEDPRWKKCMEKAGIEL